eukprot:598715-Pelagomonas_calceolata.AAC.4
MNLYFEACLFVHASLCSIPENTVFKGTRLWILPYNSKMYALIQGRPNSQENPRAKDQCKQVLTYARGGSVSGMDRGMPPISPALFDVMNFRDLSLAGAPAANGHQLQVVAKMSAQETAFAVLVCKLRAVGGAPMTAHARLLILTQISHTWGRAPPLAGCPTYPWASNAVNPCMASPALNPLLPQTPQLL